MISNNLSVIRVYILRTVSATRFILALLLVVWAVPCYGQAEILVDDAARPVERFTSDPLRAGDVQLINEKIDPRPEPPSYATPDIHIDLNTLVKYGSEAWFKNAVLYHFSVDLVPNFVGQNASKRKFCVYEDQFKNSVESQRTWDAMKASPVPVKYRVFINKMDWGGETEAFYPPKIFFDASSEKAP